MGVINAFPGYEFVYDPDDKKWHNMYRGTDVGFGGYVYADVGMYENVALLDIASQHPSSIIAMNYFGEYTQNFKDLLDARIAIKHGEFDRARTMLGGKLAKYLTDESQANDLAKATKIALNSCYGLTAANFDNPMRDSRNKNNIVALRGALFMRTLQDEIIARGYRPIHFKTDSVKIANATPEIIQFVMDFAKPYGYTFELEAIYDRICLVNGSTYIARYSDDVSINGKNAGTWTATAKQFQVPYVFKTLFSKESIVFEDLCETKEVKTALYLDMNESLPEDDHNYVFIGKVGNFCPIKPGFNGGELLREGKDAEGNTIYSAATGTKGYRWLEAEMVKTLGKEDAIDRSYYDRLVDDAVEAISQYGDFEMFASDEPFHVAKDEPGPYADIPWYPACGGKYSDNCWTCPNLQNDEFHLACKLGHDISDFVGKDIKNERKN